MVDLAGRRVLITRPREQYAEFAEKLTQYGAVPIAFPVINIAGIENTHELDQALQTLDQYQWLVFTSVNGVKEVWKCMNVLGIKTIPSEVRVAAIGPKTAAALEERGVRVNFVPDEYIAEAILPGLGEVKDKRILLLRADIARPDLTVAIQMAGGDAHEIAVYHTLQGSPTEVEWAELEKGVDVITFTSASTVKNFLDLLHSRNRDIGWFTKKPIIACIGPIAARAAHERGLEVDIVAKEYTIDGLVFAINEFDLMRIRGKEIND